MLDARAHFRNVGFVVVSGQSGSAHLLWEADVDKL